MVQSLVKTDCTTQIEITPLLTFGARSSALTLRTVPLVGKGAGFVLRFSSTYMQARLEASYTTSLTEEQDEHLMDPNSTDP